MATETTGKKRLEQEILEFREILKAEPNEELLKKFDKVFNINEFGKIGYNRFAKIA